MNTAWEMFHNVITSSNEFTITIYATIEYKWRMYLKKSRKKNTRIMSTVWTSYAYIPIFKDGASSAITGFHASPLPWSNLRLKMLVFVKGGKLEYPGKTLRVRRKTTRNSTHIWHRARLEPGSNKREGNALTTTTFQLYMTLITFLQ